MAKHLGIKIKFVGYFGDDIHGKLLPREKRILINAHKPRVEHMFTVLHEIGHFLIHFKRLPRIRHPRVFDINWRVEWLMRLCSHFRRHFRFRLNSEKGKEWDADLWAMCAFFYLVKAIGCRDELLAFIDRHPEKIHLLLLAACGFIYSRAKERTKRIVQVATVPFQMLRRSVVS